MDIKVKTIKFTHLSLVFLDINDFKDEKHLREAGNVIAISVSLAKSTFKYSHIRRRKIQLSPPSLTFRIQMDSFIQLKHVLHLFNFLCRRKAIRAAVIEVWPGNNIPTFKNNKEAEQKLNNLVKDLEKECTFEPLNFGKEGIRQHVLDVLNERRRHVRKGRDYSLVSSLLLNFIFQINYMNNFQF